MLEILSDKVGEFDSGRLNADEFSRAIGSLDVPWRVGVTAADFGAHVRHRRVANCIFGEMSFGSCTGTRDHVDTDRQGIGYVCVSHQKDGRLNFVQQNRTMTIERGDLLLWDDITPSEFTADEPGNFELIWFPTSLVERRIGPITGPLGQRAGVADNASRLLSGHLQNLHRMIGDMTALAQQRVLEATIDLVFACFHDEAEMTDELPVYQKDILLAARNEIACNIDRGVSPSFVAGKLGVSIRHLQKIFAKTGLTFSECVQQERVELARRMLMTQKRTNLTLTEIAHLAGFCDLSHFNRSFARFYGMSPSRYRAMN